MRIGPHKHTAPADRRFPDVSLLIHNGRSATSSRSLEGHLVNSPKEDITDSAVSPPSPARNPPDCHPAAAQEFLSPRKKLPCLLTSWLDSAFLPPGPLFDLLLDAKLVGMTALLLSAIDCPGVQAGVAPEVHSTVLIALRAKASSMHPPCPSSLVYTDIGKLLKSQWNCRVVILCHCMAKRLSAEHLATHFLQIILSWLYFLARICRDGSMMPPRRRITRWRVESAKCKIDKSSIVI